jgi:murein L,D-transpeptidase YcbB/YkuD
MRYMFIRLIAAVSLTPALIAVPVAPSRAASAVKSLPDQIKSASSGKYRKFYKARGYLPIWARKGTIGPEADAFVALLRDVGHDGLDPNDYAPDQLKQAIDRARSGEPGELGRTELKLSRAFFAYVRDIRRSRSEVANEIVYADRKLAPSKRLNPADILLPAAIAPSLAGYLETMGWMNPLYVDLRTALIDFHQRWGVLPPVTIASGIVLRVGSTGDRVRQLRNRLGLAPAGKFDKAVIAKLKLFQADHGLRPSGIADEETVTALNRGSASYEARMQLNLERARLLPPASVKHLVVNIASARLWMIDGKLSYADSMRVIVGAPDEKTPIMAGMVSYAVLNPYWNVPTDLVQKRVAKRVLNGQSFTGLRYEALSDWTADATVIPPESIDWQAVADGRRELRVRMLPGGENFMGDVKFILPNDLGIYLHDFPDKSLFKGAERHLSSGCVRLEDAPRLGRWLFGRTLAPNSPTPEQWVSLPKPVPIFMTYLTVVPDTSGIAFLDDPYGEDAREHYAAR